VTRIKTGRKDIARLRAEIAAVFAYDGDTEPRGVSNDTLRAELAAEMKAEGFKGRQGDQVVWNADGRFRTRRFVVVGLGKEDAPPGQAIRIGCARASGAAKKIHARSLALRLPPVENDRIAAEVKAAVEGALLGSYRFELYLTDPDRLTRKLDGIEVSSDGSPSVVARAAGHGEIVARAVCLARDLVNEPPTRMNPSELARRCTAEAKRAGLGVKVLMPAELRRLKMRSLLAVSRGSAVDPRVIHLVYRPKGRSRTRREKVVLVGKGLTFDTGGLNLKPGNFMDDMKCDMAGSAAVLAAMTALGETGCRVEVHGLLGLVENSIGPLSYKPGDILDTYSGKTVEVGNTDAEGRLVMCDLLSYAAKRLKPTRMIDIATLTGACVVALGPLATGLFTRDREMSDAILEAGVAAGEKLWPMPMYEEYLKDLQKGPADLRNIGGKYGGAISAALFLGEFVPDSLPWAHLDIAGPAFAEQPLPESPAGGTGAGVRTLVHWLGSL